MVHVLPKDKLGGDPVHRWPEYRARLDSPMLQVPKFVAQLPTTCLTYVITFAGRVDERLSVTGSVLMVREQRVRIDPPVKGLSCRLTYVDDVGCMYISLPPCSRPPPTCLYIPTSSIGAGHLPSYPTQWISVALSPPISYPIAAYGASLSDHRSFLDL